MYCICVIMWPSHLNDMQIPKTKHFIPKGLNWVQHWVSRIDLLNHNISILYHGRLFYFNPPCLRKLLNHLKSLPTIQNFFNKPSGISGRGHKYTQFSLFNAKIFQMTPLVLYLSTASYKWSHYDSRNSGMKF